jgi:hypothetical protein
LCHEYFGQRYDLLQIAVVVRVEIGSTRAWIKITAGVAFSTLLTYGELRQSVDHLMKDGHALAGLLRPQIAVSIGLESSNVERYEARLGAPGQLHRLFTLVERGEMTADEATTRALGIIRASQDADAILARELPGLVHALDREFRQAADRAATIETEHRRATSVDRLPGQPDTTIPRRPALGLPPHPPSRRRRGVVARANRATGHVDLSHY